jgi:hypothetical protein
MRAHPISRAISFSNQTFSVSQDGNASTKLVKLRGAVR